MIKTLDGSNKRIAGFTLIEVLIAVAIFGVVITLAYGGIVNSLTGQVRQESTVAAQGKLRRIVEVMTQELRSAVFGSIIDAPYTSNDSAVSFLLLNGGAGYAMSKYNMGDSQIEVVSSSLGSLAGRRVLIVNPQGTGVLTTVQSATVNGGKSTLRLSCGVPMAHTVNTLLFEVSALGVRFDPSTSEMYLREGLGGDELPYAFGISDFRIDYVYATVGADPIVRTSPYRNLGRPERTFEQGGREYTLARLQVVINTDAVSREGTTTHALSSQVELLANQDFTLKELTTCM